MNVKRRVFPETCKREAVDRFASTGLSAGAAARKLGLRDGPSTMDDAARDAGDGAGAAPSHAGAGPVAV